MAKATGGGAGSRPGVYVQGLPELRRALRRIDRDLDRKLAKALREIGKGVKAKVQAEARRFRDSGNLERSIRYSVRAKTSSVYTNVVYGPVHEFGGVIRPRGAPIRIPRREFMHRGVEQSRRMIDGNLESVLDFIADTWDD